MEIAEERSEGTLVMAPVGRLDSVSSNELEKRLVARIDAGDRRLVFDMAGVEYISSAGLRVLLMAAKRLEGPAGALVLCGLGPSVRLFCGAGLTGTLFCCTEIDPGCVDL